MSLVLCAHSATYWHRSLELPIVYILLKCVWMHYAFQCCWSLMSSPITSIMIICAHWPNKIYIENSESSSSKLVEGEKKVSEQNSSDATMATVDSIARTTNNKCHYHVLVSDQNTFLCDGFLCIVSHNTFYSKPYSVCHLYQIQHNLFYLLWTLTLGMRAKFPCQLLIFVLLFELHWNHKNYLFILIVWKTNVGFFIPNTIFFCIFFFKLSDSFFSPGCILISFYQ